MICNSGYTYSGYTILLLTMLLICPLPLSDVSFKKKDHNRSLLWISCVTYHTLNPSMDNKFWEVPGTEEPNVALDHIVLYIQGEWGRCYNTGMCDPASKRAMLSECARNHTHVCSIGLTPRKMFLGFHC